MKKWIQRISFVVCICGCLTLCYVTDVWWSQKMIETYNKRTEQKKLPKEGDERGGWQYSVEYPGGYYTARARFYDRQRYVSGRWCEIPAEVLVDIYINCECGNNLEMRHPTTLEGFPLKYTCSQCDKVYEFVIQDDILVEVADTILDDKELFLRSRYVRFWSPAP